MKKIHTKITIILVVILSLLHVNKASAASGGYQYENIAFYAQSSSIGYAYEGISFYAFEAQETDSLPVYRFLNATSGDHFYTISESEKNIIITNSQWGYTYEGVGFYAFDNQVSDSLPVYRFLNATSGDHFYTISESEKNIIITNSQWGYTYEGISFYAFEAQETDSLPVYRFLNATNGDHFYTISESEKDGISVSMVYRFSNTAHGNHFYTSSETEKNNILNNPQSGYAYEGVGFYAFNYQVTSSLPIYRFYKSTNGAHFYTISEAEKDIIINNPQWGYTYEYIAFYAFPTQVSEALPVYRFLNSTTDDHFYTISESEKNYLIIPTLGPDIAVGLWNYTRADIQDSPFKIKANKTYNIKNGNGEIISQIPAATITRVTYDSGGNLEIYGSVTSTLLQTEVSFDSADGNNLDMIFDVYRPNSSYDQYRGKIKVRYTDNSNIWVINTLPLEHYVWGDGETTGTGHINHTQVMTTIFRTYGHWYVKYATAYAPYGFKIRSDSGSQIYSGYDWEIAHPNIRTAAENTRGVIASYNSDVALTPYSSWTDGRTRSFQERWGSADYPWCQSVSDPYGKHASMTTAELEAAGNHMVGLSANGSVNLAANYGWDWQRIMQYYYTNISLAASY